MKSTKAASRYAKAILELAIEQNVLDQVAGDMNYIVEVNGETKDFQVLLSSPVINPDRKLAIFNELFGQFEKLSMMFIDLITRNRREYMLVEIAQSFSAQLKAYCGIVPITLISAVQLDNVTKEKIFDKVRASVTGVLEINEIIDPSLIGGFIIRMDDKQIDASISSQLSNLKQRLTR